MVYMSEIPSCDKHANKVKADAGLASAAACVRSGVPVYYALFSFVFVMLPGPTETPR